MRTIKTSITIILLLFLILSGAGTVFAAADATISASFDKNTVDVGDQVNLIVTIKNTGDQDLNSVLVLAPLPSGLKFVMSATGTSKNLYDSSTGVWEVDNLRLTSKGGGIKTLTITATVQSSLEGKSTTANAKFTGIAYGDPSVSILDRMNSVSSNTLTVRSTRNNNGNSTQTNSTGTNSTNSNNNNQNNTNNGSTNSNADKKNTVSEALKNATKPGNGLETLQTLNQGAKPKSYEISNVTNQNNQTPDNPYLIIGGLIMAVLIAIGYFKGIKN